MTDILNPHLRPQFERLALRKAELDTVLTDPKVVSDMKRYRSLLREQSEISSTLERYEQYLQRERDVQAAHQLLRDSSTEADLAELARLEVEEAHADMSNAFVEIRAGTGGDESALFAGDLLRMYLRYCEQQGWRTEIMSESASDLGGFLHSSRIV
jgi:peptide chain release factor 1